MSVNRTVIDARPGAVFAVLKDGWTYARWVVGARKIREVDPAWPAPGSKFHHTVGVGPLVLRDHTESITVHEPEQLILHAHAKPTGVARVNITLRAVSGGTEVTLEETPVSGPVKWLHNPVLEVLTYVRNLEALRRFKRLVEAEHRRAPARRRTAHAS